MHVEKFQRSAVGHMLRHYNRMTMNFGNENIDHLRSDLNYNLAPNRHMADIDYYRTRLSEVKCQNRIDVKTLCSWIITLPKTITEEEEEKRFFKESYDFMIKRYGQENVISAWVHKDEDGQPHLHFAFIPICVDKKKQIEKVSAKEVLTKTELKSIHREMSEYMERVFNRDIGILNGSTAGGNKTVMELKSQSLKNEVIALEHMKSQSIVEMAETIKKKPYLLSNITKAIKVVLGKEQLPTPEKQIERSRSR